ncbi:MAG: hypothetical protein QM755_07720 [Luteolibacter sp.]
MPNSSERFLDDAVDSFTNNPELQIHARRELEERIDPAFAEDPSWDTAAERLQRHDRKWWRGKTGFILLILIVAAFFTCYFPGLTDLFNTTKTLSSIGGDYSTDGETSAAARERLSKGLTVDQQLILFGSSSVDSDKLQGQELWERHPDDPSYFAAYARSYVGEHKELPPDYLEIASRLDPDNAWFPTFAAATIGSRSVKALPRTEEEKKARKPKQWEILDPAGLDQAVELLVKANSLPRFEAYGDKLYRERIELIPAAHDFTSYVTRVVIAAGSSNAGGPMQKVVEPIGAHVQRLVEGGKAQELHAFLLMWKDFGPRMLGSGKDLISVLVSHGIMVATVRIFKEATQKLDLSENAGVLDRLDQALMADRSRRQNIDTTALQNLLSARGSMLSQIGLPMVSSQAHHGPVIDEAAVKPLRLVDHAWAARLFSLGVFAFMGVACGCTSLFRLRHGRLTRLLSKRIVGIMTPVDWIWVLVVGGCGPLLVYEGIQYLTPLGIRDWNLLHVLKAKPAPQLDAWASLSLIAPIVITRWRFQLRTRGLALTHPRPWLGWTLLAVSLALVPLSGLFLTHDLAKPWAIAWAAANLTCGMWGLVIAIRALCTSQANALGQQATARMITAAYGATMLALAVMALVSRVEERYWLARDPLMQIGTDTPSMGQFECQVAIARKAEIAEILAPMKEIR